MRLLAALACSTALLVATLAPSVTTGASAEEQPTAAQQVLAEARALLTGATGEGPAARRYTGEPGVEPDRRQLQRHPVQRARQQVAVRQNGP